ncbi:sensor histidine kinase [Paenibacillus gallinarum]|uniref:Heme sensor protein HssS n=1 Tax=Paenibacillus gallinarum TaxID=2762232 RepID=A0ABR8SYL7_9BACL|nr:HAMP domain-containing sensor histidine kinase [Paenibacillus gallinarum]MBD7968449.1 HAMP domain-containing histidine kinase [Paenibacillus gallinarum]
MKTLYLRIVLTTALVMLLSSLLAFVISNMYYQYNLKPYNDEKMTDMTNDIIQFYKENPEVSLPAYLNSIGDLGYQIYLADSPDQGTFYGGDFRKKNLDSDLIRQVLGGQVYHGIADFPAKLFITGFFDNSLGNSIGMPITVNGETHALFVRPNVELQFGELRIFFALLLVLTTLISIILVFISTRYIVKPVTRLTEATKQIAKGNYHIKLNARRRDEIGKLANHFSQMAKSLEQLESMRQEFVSNVSHEIQSPLTSIQGFSERLKSNQLTEEERLHYLDVISSESRRLSQLSKQLLTLASLDKEESIIDKQLYSAKDQIKQVVYMLEWNWREKEIALDLQLSSAEVYADPKWMHQVWVNLITNSIKFTDPGGTIRIRLEEKNNHHLIEIEDTGIGIKEEDLPYIFNRFYKTDKVRNRSEGSSGLGLAIVKRIIDMHDGQITVHSELGKGTCIQIWIPISSPE